MEYKYKVIQLAPTIISKNKNAAAEYLEGIINNSASEGWEFYRIDNMSVQKPSGCLGSLSGKAEDSVGFNMAVFRKEK